MPPSGWSADTLLPVRIDPCRGGRPGVGAARSLLAVRLASQLFLAPDNGLLAGLAAADGAEVRRIDLRVLRHAGLPQVSTTIHGRDLFAALTAELVAGGLQSAALGRVTANWVTDPGATAQRTARRFRGEVILADNV